ncbi:MAG: CDP-alcohol phosphatidyltransferase family protein [Nitrospirae bacterium]|nr:CDP-alcohol phosphatidyltransferase family protein [Candidatus Troglogloeales bacterium]
MTISFKFNYITPPENGGQVIFRFLSTLIVRGLAKTPIIPNHVTVSRMLIVIVALYLFALGDPVSLLWAVGLFYMFEVLDHVDGDLARYTKHFSKAGPLLEQFIDTWSSRPSNIFGLCIAIGMYNRTQEITGFVLFGATALGRLLWLEYRDYFGWVRVSKEEATEYRGVLGASSLKAALRNLFEILYIWNNTFLLLGALLYIPVQSLIGLDSLVVGFVIVAILNNLPWIAILYQGFSSARGGQL